MTRALRRSSVVAALALLALAPLAEAVRPPAGTKYQGKTSQGRTIKLVVSASGTGLVMRYPERFACRGVRDQEATAIYRKDRPTIKADGSYRFRMRYASQTVPALPGPFAETQRLSGRFSSDASSVSGRSFVRIFNKRFACRSGITFTAARVP